MREYARLQGTTKLFLLPILTPNQRTTADSFFFDDAGFPDSVDFSLVRATKVHGDHLAEQYRAIGNAVPPPLAAAFGRELDKVLVQLTLDAPDPANTLTAHRERAKAYRDENTKKNREVGGTGVGMGMDVAGKSRLLDFPDLEGDDVEMRGEENVCREVEMLVLSSDEEDEEDGGSEV